jgi:hypothetical protein
MFEVLKNLVANLDEIDTSKYKDVVVARKSLQAIKIEAQKVRKEIAEAGKEARKTAKAEKVAKKKVKKEVVKEEPTLGDVE